MGSLNTYLRITDWISITCIPVYPDLSNIIKTPNA